MLTSLSVATGNEVVFSLETASDYEGLLLWFLTSLSVATGNEVVFSLETASDYVKDDKACYYGFKCTVVGYEWTSRPEEVRPGLVAFTQCATDEYAYRIPNPYTTLVPQGKGTKYPR